MSGSDTVGDLIPQDVAEVFAQERNSKSGRRKKRRGSLGRAFNWLKGKKRKGVRTTGESLGLGPGLALEGLEGQGVGRPAAPPGHATPKEEHEPRTVGAPLFQENVFVEGSRPKHLEDLHSEAQEGLMLLQQEDNNNGVNYQDEDRSISRTSNGPGEDRRGWESDSTIQDSVSIVSNVSTVSTISTVSAVSSRLSRAGLTRQSSTFRPLNSGSKPEKAKTKRRHRRTVAGIPQQVHRELGLDRAAWAARQEREVTSDNNPTMEEPAIVTGKPPRNGLPPLSEDPCHKDDLALLQRLGPQLLDQQRPHSLAVPWLTTAHSLQAPPSPVMSMSPQATYLSKIIPNAVLPPAVEVVEISRGRSRHSLRTVSKSSLLLSSPNPSHTSSRASSRASSKASTISSASRYNPPHFSDSSGWSRSGSSETLVSDSSTVSSTSTLQQGTARRPHKEGSSNGQVKPREKQAGPNGPLPRSLSVMKSKRAPPPPSRSYSLHKEKMKRRSRDLDLRGPFVPHVSPAPSASCGDNAAGETASGMKDSPDCGIIKTTDSPGYHADTSSLEDSHGSVSASPLQPQQHQDQVDPASPYICTEDQPLENGLKQTVSPSSGYSSQGLTPIPSTKQSQKYSPARTLGLLAKLQGFFTGGSPLLVPEPGKEAPNEAQIQSAPTSASIMSFQEPFNIPAHPNVVAPPPPPPEVWSQSIRSIELLLGPPAPNCIYSAVRKNPKDRRQQRQNLPGPAEGAVEQAGQASVIKLGNGKAHAFEKANGQEKLNVQESESLRPELSEGVLGSVKDQSQKETLKASGKVVPESAKETVQGSVNVTSVNIPKYQTANSLARQQEKPRGDKQNIKNLQQNTETLSVAVSSLMHVSPSPSPPPAHNPPNPPVKQTPTLVPEPPMSPGMESSWPPPPLLSDQPTVRPLSGLFEMDCPPPPPPCLPTPDTTGAHAPLVTSPVLLLASSLPPGIPPPPSHAAPTPPTLTTPPPPTHPAPAPPTEREAISSYKYTLSAPQTLPSSPSSTPAPPQTIPTAPQTVCLPPQTTPTPPQTILGPPQTIPPPPQSILMPPQSIPAPPHPIPAPPQNISSLPQTLLTTTQAFPGPPQTIPPPPPFPNKTMLSAPQTVHSPTEANSAPSKDEASSPVVTPSLLQMVKLRSVCRNPAVGKVEKDVPLKTTQLSQTLATQPSKEAPPPTAQPNQGISPPSTQLNQEAPPPTTQPSKEAPSAPTQPKNEAPPPFTKPSQETLIPSTESSQEAPPPSTQPSQGVSPTATQPSREAPPPAAQPSQEAPPPATQPSQEAPPPDSQPCQGASPPATQPSQGAPPPATQPSLEAPPPAAQPSQEAPPPAAQPSQEAPPPAAQPSQEAPPPATQPSQEAPPPATQPSQEAPPSAAQPSQEAPPSAAQPSQEAPPLAAHTSKEAPPLAAQPSQEAPPLAAQPSLEAPPLTTQPSQEAPPPSTQTSQEAPQKPIRRSMILVSPTSPSPPTTVLSQPAPVVPQSSAVPTPISLPATHMVPPVSPNSRKSPPAAAAPSMRLQEAIRLRTAARASKDGSSSRLSLQPPTSPTGGDKLRSPSSTASFIFSKSNKKVVIETCTSPTAQANLNNNLLSELSSVPNATKSSISSPKNLLIKVPPPVSKKPKSMAKETDNTVETVHVQTAGQEAQPEVPKVSAEKHNGTATVR